MAILTSCDGELYAKPAPRADSVDSLTLVLSGIRSLKVINSQGRISCIGAGIFAAVYTNSCGLASTDA